MNQASQFVVTLAWVAAFKRWVMRDEKGLRMTRRTVFVSVIVAIFAVATLSCGSGSSSSATPHPTPMLTPVPTTTPEASTVNVVEAFDLNDAARIEVFELTVDGPGYLLRTVFSDSDVVSDLIDALDEDLVLGSRVRCPENFRLRFFFSGGRTETLGLVCFSEPDLVRGDDSVFGFHDAPLPTGFQLAFSTAMSVVPGPDQVSSDRIVPLAIAEIVAEHPELAEFTNFEYERINLTQPMIVGASRYAYQSLEWRVEVSWPVVAQPVFKVTVTSLSTGIEWEGEFTEDQATRGPRITPEDPVISDQVLDVVLARLIEQHRELTVMSTTGFQRYDLTPEGLIGASRFGYRNRDWELDIGWPVVLEPVFSVTVRAPGTGFTWTGEVLMSELPGEQGVLPEAM